MKEFRKGLKAALPILTGYVPIAIAYAAMAHSAQVPALLTVAMSLFVYTGAGQIAAVNMLAAGMGASAIIVTVFVMNLRHIIMSTVVMEKLGHLKTWKKVLLALGVTDEVFAVFTTQKRQPALWLAGLAVGAWLSWNVGTIIGLLFLRLVPLWILDTFGIAQYAMFLALIVPGIRSHLRLLVPVGATGIMCWGLQGVVSGSTAIVLASLAGAVTGLFTVREEDLT